MARCVDQDGTDPVRQLARVLSQADVGPVDILDGLKDRDGRTIPYHELAPRAVVIDVSGTTVRVAALDDIITAKEHADRWVGTPEPGPI